MTDEGPEAPLPPERAPETPEERAARLKLRRRSMDFFAALFGTFLLGWAASFVGTEQQIEWLYFTGLALVGLPLLILMAWLGH